MADERGEMMDHYLEILTRKPGAMAGSTMLAPAKVGLTATISMTRSTASTKSRPQRSATCTGLQRSRRRWTA